MNRFSRPLTLGQLAENSRLTAKSAAYLSIAMEEGKSVLVGGMTGSGKTTMMAALLLAAPKSASVSCFWELAPPSIQGFPACASYEGSAANSALEEAIRTLPSDIVFIDGASFPLAAEAFFSFKASGKQLVVSGFGDSPQTCLEKWAEQVSLSIGQLEANKARVAAGLDIVIQTSLSRNGALGFRSKIEIFDICGYSPLDGEFVLESVGSQIKRRVRF